MVPPTTKRQRSKRPQGPGRPATGHDPNWTFRLPASLIKKIDEAAKGQSTTRAVLVKRCLKAEFDPSSSD